MQLIINIDSPSGNEPSISILSQSWTGDNAFFYPFQQFFANSFHPQQIFDTGKIAVPLPVVHDRLSFSRTDSLQRIQLRRRRAVNVDASVGAGIRFPGLRAFSGARLEARSDGRRFSGSGCLSGIRDFIVPGSCGGSRLAFGLCAAR